MHPISYLVLLTLPCSYLFVKLSFASATNAPIACSSLDGPYCFFVNGLEIPKHLSAESLPNTVGDLVETSPAEVEKALKNLLQQLDKKKVAKKPKSTTPQVHSGLFSVSGIAIAKVNFAQLNPGKWLVQPDDGWIMIGARGGFNKRLKIHDYSGPKPVTKPTVIFDLLDPTTERRIVSCSPLVLTRLRKGITRHFLDGTWTGKYSCLGSRGVAKLVLISRATRTQRTTRHIQGTFHFVAETFPGRDSTLSGCKCVQTWAYAGVQFENGQCGKPDEESMDPWCFIEMDTCTKLPAGANWDWCEPKEEMIFHFNQEGEFIPI